MREAVTFKKTSNKRGSNKGIARARKEQRREEAEARNLLTPNEKRRVVRLAVGKMRKDIGDALEAQVIGRSPTAPQN